jgi:tetratricopeptide (TPR) repeat protein
MVTASARQQPAATATAVRVWTGTVEIPVSVEGPANPNPPFDVFSFGRFNYPYPLRDALTDRRERTTLRSVHLENEYLRLTVLPDLGGHVYSCLDKRTGREMFYANTAIKKALIGYRGAWAAFGIEFNFPVSHNWVSLSPVDFATTRNEDGSASIWVGNVDQVYRSQWRVELRLAAGRTVLEQHVELYNPTDVRHRYYWWSNAAVQVWADSQMVYPTELMATHGFTRIEPWPVDQKGRDLSMVRNQTDGPVSLFTYGTREPFVGVYHPHTSSGVVHVAAPAELPTHKFWSWGNDREAASWRQALSDDDSGYVELQAGLFRNQETYAFLEPQETVRFTEYWVPVRDLGGITRANVDAVLHMERTSPTHMRIAVETTRDVRNVHVTINDGQNAVDAGGDVLLSPRDIWRKELDGLTAAPVTIEVTDRLGRVIVRHTENEFDRTPKASVRLGPQTDPRLAPGAPGPADLVERGLTDELEGRRLAAVGRYRAGLEHYPRSFPLLKAAGRLAVALGWADGGAANSSRAIDWLEAAYSANTTDFEVQYYYGLALEAAGRTRDARRFLEASQRFRATRAAATLALARLSAREGDPAAALVQLESMHGESPRASLAGALEVALLRRLDRIAEARERAQYWRTIDPTGSLLRYELTLLGDADPDLWRHLGSDSNRVLDLADEYLAIGGYADALALLGRVYPRLDPSALEPGVLAPHDSPLVPYYRGFARERLGRDPGADYAAASALSTAYVFPSRRSSYAVLDAALRANPEDSTARFLLGSLYLASGQVQPAVAAWQRVRRVRPAIPTLHRSLGLALLQSGDAKGARAVLEEGAQADSGNVDVFLALDGVLSAANASARDRVTALRRYPGPMPASLVFKLALALAEAGDAPASERLFHHRFFPSEEGGASVRSVYAQVRLTSAAAAVSGGDCGGALRILDSLSADQPDLAFTAGGLMDALTPPVMARQAAAVESACGRRSAARARWERLARALDADGSGPLPIAIADAARRQLGRPRTPVESRRLEAALAAATGTLESGGTSNPGQTEYVRASLLAALGRVDESMQSLQRVFLFPDRNLSHALARAELRVPSRGRRR